MKKYSNHSMIKSIMGACVALVLLSLAGCSKKAAPSEVKSLTLKPGVLQVGVNVAYPPFEYYGDDGKTKLGFDMDLSRELAKKMGLEVEILDVDWEGIFAGLDTDRYDIIVSGVTLTPERLEKYAFTKPYVGNGQAVVVRSDSSLKVSEITDLTGKNVGYLTESTSDVFMTKKVEEGLQCTVNEYDDAMNSFSDLKAGRLDAVVADSLVAADYVGRESGTYKVAWQGEAEEYLGVVVKKGNDELLSKVSSALDALFADGTVKELSVKNFGADIVSSLDRNVEIK